MKVDDIEWIQVEHQIHRMKEVIRVCEAALEDQALQEVVDSLTSLRGDLKKMSLLNNTNGDFSLASPNKMIFNVQNLHFGTNPGDG